VPKVSKGIKRKPARDARIEALQLLGKWTSLGQAHVLLGGSCSCGVGGASLRVEDFEEQILDYLAGRHAVARESGSVAALLRSIATRARDASADPSLALLDDLKRTLDSFDELHRTR
jgi:hypothetical protein